jgi:hypothetical protein
VSRRTVVNFFEMLRVRIKFKAHMSRKHAARMTYIPQLEVPEIYIENEEDRASREAGGAASATRPGLSREPTSETTIVSRPQPPAGSTTLSPTGPSTNPFLSAAEAAHPQHRSWSGVPTDFSSFDAFYGGGATRVGEDDGDQGAAAGHRTQDSAFSFELHEPEGQGGAGGGPSNRSSRRGSTVRPEQVTEMLNSSVWMDSIRRSVTQRGGPGRGQGGGSEGGWGGGYGRW